MPGLPRGRSGYRYFPEDGNYLYEMAQFYPRMCVYDDIKGWEGNPSWARRSSRSEFGDFKSVSMHPKTMS
ncbi:MAG: hypothetical protein U0176_00555 [Bacteroidia bacterium]